LELNHKWHHDEQRLASVNYIKNYSSGFCRTSFVKKNVFARIAYNQISYLKIKIVFLFQIFYVKILSNFCAPKLHPDHYDKKYYFNKIKRNFAFIHDFIYVSHEW